ncbi:MAG TPA: hypothetical protein DCE41_05095 [Cytophagales bacterium]|nr:hypothetical protein [Cytophagales bacterium]
MVMRTLSSPILWLLIMSMAACTPNQTPSEYRGGWAGTIQESNPFSFSIDLELNATDPWVRFTGKDTVTILPLQAEDSKYLVARFEDQLTFRLDTNGGNLTAFVHAGHHLSHLPLEPTGPNAWSGHWDLLIEGTTTSPTLYLSMDSLGQDQYGVSTFFKEPSYHYMWINDFLLQEDRFLSFREIRSNIQFSGELKESRIDLTLQFLLEKTDVAMQRMPYDEWDIGGYATTARERPPEQPFADLIRAVENDTLERTHAVVIAQGGEVILEEYFDNFLSSTPHDTRSMSKSFASTALGLAIEDGLISSENELMMDYFSEGYPEVDWSEGKDRITLHHLLSMTSGLDGNEGHYQNQEDWTAAVLNSEMMHAPGDTGRYRSGNPHLIGPILTSVLENERLEFYLHRRLFGPLGITNYRLQTSHEDVPYFGGGWFFTPMDLVKFGQLYLNQGQTQAERLLPKAWVEKSFLQYNRLEGTKDNNAYGYLFWHYTYPVKGKGIVSIEGRGAGGQYLFIIPELDMVAAITSGNYRNGKIFQPERIMEEFILPKLVK